MVGYFTTRVKLLYSLDKDAWLPARLSGADVVGARDSSLSHLCFVWLFLATKTSHLGADINGLTCFLHRPTVYG
jgi:hypothetical protein